jgi:hypothetical protein
LGTKNTKILKQKLQKSGKQNYKNPRTKISQIKILGTKISKI